LVLTSGFDPTAVFFGNNPKCDSARAVTSTINNRQSKIVNHQSSIVNQSGFLIMRNPLGGLHEIGGHQRLGEGWW
jgi:hypothetical protein